MSDRPPLPPGILPNIFDTDPPPTNPATIVADGITYVDQSLLSGDEAAAFAEVIAQHPNAFVVKAEEPPPPPPEEPTTP